MQVKEDAEGADIAELDFSTTNSITVTYNGNGDGVTSVPEAQTETDTTGKYFTIASAEGMKKEGYTFIKWQTAVSYTHLPTALALMSRGNICTAIYLIIYFFFRRRKKKLYLASQMKNEKL